MRNNQPVTNQEYKLRDGVAIISRTNAKGQIVDCNDEFVEASGFTREEVIGQPHNMVRHPDMPSEAFRDLWETLKSGRPWSGMVKNRRKNGDHYWVRATATPLADGSGYVSVRVKPDREEVSQAEALYRRMNAGAKIRLQEGHVQTGNPYSRLMARLERIPKLLMVVQGILLTLMLISTGAGLFPLAAQERWILSGVSGLCSLLLLLVAMPATSRSYRKLSEAGAAAAAIAAGDLTRAIPDAGRDEIGELMTKFAIMRNNLIELVATVHQNVAAVLHSASELSASAKISAQAIETQSEAASSMAAAVEQLSVSIDQVDEHAREARGITQSSGQKSAEGGRIIHDTAEEMRRIADAVNNTAKTIQELENVSGQISSIVQVIDDIASQTNLLALNAAIEAARAGEQGRGFAVVADEVRKLAERTSSSTHEISAMIDKIQQGTQRAVQEMEAGVLRVNEGVQLAGKAGDSVIDIRAGSEQVTRAVDDISLALKEQVMAAQEIAIKVERIAQSSEENSATVSQTAVSAHRMEELAQELSGIAGRFRIS